MSYNCGCYLVRNPWHAYNQVNPYIEVRISDLKGETGYTS